jgi:5'-methylthioadenosine phosphorylase
VTGRVQIGIIGGSGLYDIEGIADVTEERVKTPFGDPSDSYIIGSLAGHRVAFLARHGRGHGISPTELNFRANIYGLKALGVERIIAVSAVGSMKEGIHPMDLVFPDQFIDRTRQRVSTFFGEGIVAHVAFSDPICPALRGHLSQTAKKEGARVHDGGTYLCIEGPQFSTRAESRLYRSWGVSVIGMTNLQEAKLAREAEICYATMALATDYDCWHVSEEPVTIKTVIGYMKSNSEMAKKVLTSAVTSLPDKRSCSCGSALENAIITQPEAIPSSARQKLALLLDKYLSE